MGHIVTAPLVQALTDKGTFVHVYEGGFLPDDQDAHQLEQLVAAGMVEEAEQPAETADEDKPKRSRAKAS